MPWWLWLLISVVGYAWIGFVAGWTYSAFRPDDWSVQLLVGWLWPLLPLTFLVRFVVWSSGETSAAVVWLVRVPHRWRNLDRAPYAQ